jgi:NADH dehydrogenase FAD-containing subunit
MKNIVILGGNFAGVSTAHYLLRHVLPSLHSTGGASSAYKVTLVSPSDHTYFKISAPRVLITDKLPIDLIFGSIPDAFSQYKSSEFSFIQGEAIGVDEVAKTVSIRGVGKGETTSVQYDSLVIATGATAEPLWSLNGEHKATIAALQDINRRLPKAKSILIAGGGPTGIETAAEIAFHYKVPDVTLLSGTSRLLSRLQNANVPRKAEQRLSALNVKVVHNVRVVSETQVEGGTKTALKLSDGQIRVVDIYLNATGGKPNTSFLPDSWLDDAKKFVATESMTLRALKAPAGVYCIGDAASYSKGGIPDAMWAVPALGFSIWCDIQGDGASGANGGEKMQSISATSTKSRALKEKRYKQIQSDMQVVPVGPKGGVGSIFGWSVPSWIVWLLKSRTFGLEKAAELVTGSQFLKP